MITGNSTISAANIYQSQTYEEIELETGIDLSTATSLAIAFKKPDGTTGSWPASENGTKATVEVDATGQLDQSGVWVFQVVAVIAGKVAYGKEVCVRVQRPVVFVDAVEPPVDDDVFNEVFNDVFG